MSKNRKINYSNSETIGRSDWSGELGGAGMSIRLVACHSARCMILCSSFLHSRGGIFFKFVRISAKLLASVKAEIKIN